MTCESLITKFLQDYCAAALPLARKLEFELHLTLCSDCRKYVDSYRKTVFLAKGASKIEALVPEELISAIMKITRNQSRQS